MGNTEVTVPVTEVPHATYPFFSNLAKIINSGQARSIILYGNIYDLYYDGKTYVPLIPFLNSKTKIPGLIQIVHEVNGPIRIHEEDRVRLREAWAAWRNGVALDQVPVKEVLQDGSKFELRRKEFEQYMREVIGSGTQA
ncbi:MAG: hypothetical protein ACKN9U_16045, partial [Pirellulaceae bacterium]